MFCDTARALPTECDIYWLVNNSGCNILSVKTLLTKRRSSSMTAITDMNNIPSFYSFYTLNMAANHGFTQIFVLTMRNWIDTNWNLLHTSLRRITNNNFFQKKGNVLLKYCDYLCFSYSASCCFIHLVMSIFISVPWIWNSLRIKHIFQMRNFLHGF